MEWWRVLLGAASASASHTDTHTGWFPLCIVTVTVTAAGMARHGQTTYRPLLSSEPQVNILPCPATHRFIEACLGKSGRSN